MERVGFKADYLKESSRLKTTLKKEEQFMYDLTGQEFSIGQHELIKIYYIMTLMWMFLQQLMKI